MNHQCCPAAAEYRMRIIFQGDIRRIYSGFCFAFGIYFEIRDVPRVRPFSVFQPMVFVVRIEMGSRRFEIRTLAFCGLMHMQSVFSCRTDGIDRRPATMAPASASDS